MLNILWKISIRNILKHKLLSVINIIGLAVGLASSLLIIMHVSHELSFDRSWANYKDIYRISLDRYQNGELSFRSARTLEGMAAVLRERIPEITGSTELFKDVVTAYNEDNQLNDIKMFATDSTFFSVFKLDFINQIGANPLTGLHSSVLSESAAMSLFGTTDAVGKWYKVCQGWRFCVTGVYKDLPSNTHLPFDMLLTLPTYYYYFQNWDDSTGTEKIRNPNAHINKKPITSWDWGYNGVYTYILTRPGSDPEKINSEIESIAVNYTEKIRENDGRTEFHLQPFKTIHLNSNLEHEIKPNGDRNSVIVLISISFIILCFAWINFINLTLIRAVEHSKSTGLRKIVGALKKQLVAQFMTEALITNFISIVIALLLVFLIKDWFANITDMPVVNKLGWEYGFPLIILIAAGILISGLYPALHLASYKPVDLFKGIHSSGSKNLDLRKILVVGQFAASILLMAGVFTVYKQINYMKRQELGVNIKRTIVTFSPPTMNARTQRVSRLKSYKSLIKNIPRVEAIATSGVIPGHEILWKRQDVRKIGDPPNTVKTYAYTYIDYDYVKTFELSIIAGRNYSESENEKELAVIANETAVRQLGFKDNQSAVNSFILVGEKQYEIVGVIKDFHQESLKKDIKPILFFFGYSWMSDIGFYSIRVNTSDMNKTISQIGETWNKIYPGDHFIYFFLDEDYNAQYRSDQTFGRVFSMFTGLAIFVASIGLFGLAIYTASQRSKEIGIRKVNGARSSEILVMLNKNFVKWVAIAFVISTPLAWYIMNKWLLNFAYRTTLSWWIFILAGMVALFIALITVTWQSWKTATRNPVEALRYE
ncbi:MAG: ABC transporter permease [Bacteroidales bacterium]|nr:ABC transporter permease [Bacteroidales bacterium]